MVEVVANTLMLTVALIIGGILLHRGIQRLVEMTFARVARVEASTLDDELRRLSE